MRLTPRRSFRPLLIVIGLLLLGYAIWGLYASYPDFSQFRSEAASIRIAPPTPTP